MRAVAKARILEITLSVMGTGADGYPNPDRLQIPNTASIAANQTNVDLASRAIGDSASSDRLVISVRIKGAKKRARYRLGSGGIGG